MQFVVCAAGGSLALSLKINSLTLKCCSLPSQTEVYLMLVTSLARRDTHLYSPLSEDDVVRYLISHFTSCRCPKFKVTAEVNKFHFIHSERHWCLKREWNKECCVSEWIYEAPVSGHNGWDAQTGLKPVWHPRHRCPTPPAHTRSMPRSECDLYVWTGLWRAESNALSPL